MAVYDAVVAIEGGFEPYLIVPGVPPGASAEAAAAAAAHGVLVAVLPVAGPRSTPPTASLAGIPDGPGEERGVLVGQQVAAGLVARAPTTAAARPFPFDPVPAPGVWRPTPPAFAARAASLAGGRDAAADRESVAVPARPPAGARQPPLRARLRRGALYGGATGSLRTPEQTETALFWTEFAPQQYNRAARSAVVSRGLSLREAARALAMADSAMTDAIIACWDAKTTYAFWRPVTAIPGGDSDGNARTAADPAWQPLRPTPNHPEYPSAHNCLAGALGEAISEVGGSRRDRSRCLEHRHGTTRHYERVADLQRDIVDARVFAGFHWRTSDEVGFRLGQRVARAGLRHSFEAVAP